MKLTSDPRVEDVFKKYPPRVRNRMVHLRNLIISTAKEIVALEVLEETLKWGEPSYITKHGSTLRMDWKEKNPNQYAMYFKCTSKLVPTFKIIYKDVFHYEGNRAILFNFEEIIPEKELQHCIRLTLTYHKIKQLPLLGS